MATSPVIKMERKQRRRSIRNLRRQSISFMELSCLPVPASPDKENGNPANTCVASQTIANSDDYGTVWMEDPTEDIRAYTKKKERRRSRLLAPLNISNMLNTTMVSVDIDTLSANDNMMNIEFDSCDVEECENLRGDMCKSSSNTPSARFESLFQSEPEKLNKDSANLSYYSLISNSDAAYVNSMESSLSLEDNSTSNHWFSANRYFEDAENASQVNTINFATPKFDEPHCVCVSGSPILISTLCINTGDEYKTSSDSVNEDLNLTHDNNISATYTDTTLSYCADHIYDMQFDEQVEHFSTPDRISNTINDADNNSEDNVAFLNESMSQNTSTLLKQAELENLSTPMTDVIPNMVKDNEIVNDISETRNKFSPTNIISRCKLWLGNVYKKLESLSSPPVENSSTCNISQASSGNDLCHSISTDRKESDGKNMLNITEQLSIDVSHKLSDPEESSIEVCQKSSVSEPSSSDVSHESSGDKIINDKYEWSRCLQDNESFENNVQSATQDFGVKCPSLEFEEKFHQRSDEEALEISAGCRPNMAGLQPKSSSLKNDSSYFPWQNENSISDDEDGMLCALTKWERARWWNKQQNLEDQIASDVRHLPDMYRDLQGKLMTPEDETGQAGIERVTVTTQAGQAGIERVTVTTQANSDFITVTTLMNNDCITMTTQMADDCITMTTQVDDDCIALTTQVDNDCIALTTQVADDCIALTTQVADDCIALTTQVADDCIALTTQASSDCVSKENIVEPKTASGDTGEKFKGVTVNRKEIESNNECIDTNDNTCTEILTNLQGSLQACPLKSDSSCSDTAINLQPRKRQSVKTKRSQPTGKRRRRQRAGKRQKTVQSNDAAMSSNVEAIDTSEESMLLSCPALESAIIENSRDLAASPDFLRSVGSPATLQQDTGSCRVSSNDDASASNLGAIDTTSEILSERMIRASQEFTKSNFVKISINIGFGNDLSESDVPVKSLDSNTFVTSIVSIHNDVNNASLTDQVITSSPAGMFTKHMLSNQKEKYEKEHPAFNIVSERHTSSDGHLASSVVLGCIDEVNEDNSSGDRQDIFSNDIVSERPVLCEGEESSTTTRTLPNRKCEHHDNSNTNISQISVTKDVVLNCSSVSSLHCFDKDATKGLLQNDHNEDMKLVSKRDPPSDPITSLPDPQSDPITSFSKDGSISTRETESDLGMENNKNANSIDMIEQQQSSPRGEPGNKKVRRKRSKRRLSANMRVVNKVELTFSEERLSPLQEMNNGELSDMIHCSPLEQDKLDMTMNQSMPKSEFDPSQLSEPNKEAEKIDYVKKEIDTNSKNMKAALKKRRNRRKSSDFVLICETTSSNDEDITANRPIRIRRTTANYTQSYKESDIDEENECDFEVYVKSKKNSKVKEVASIEDIYKNNNYKAPVERTWETIYESPRKGKFTKSENVGCKKFKRSIDFEILPQGKRRKRLQKATKRGWNAAQVRKALVSDDEIQRRLMDLDNAMLGGC